MSGSQSTGSSKELTAMIVNLKEARILEKSVQTLSLEESYASKLLDLNSKMIKFNYRRLKNNVNKIRTNLRPDEISVMRSMENEGQFRAAHPMMCSSSSATKIAAARKRLNLNSYRRAQSAMPRMIQKVPAAEQVEEEEKERSTNKHKLNEVQEPHFPCPKRLRPKTTTICMSRRESTDTAMDTARETARDKARKPARKEPVPPSTPRSPRPKSTAAILERITRAQKANKIHAPQVAYSCHDDKPNETTEPKNGAKNNPDAFGPSPYEERRQKLLSLENEAFQGLGQRKNGFVREVRRFNEENPTIVDVKPEKTKMIINSIDSMAARSGMSEGGGRRVSLLRRQYSEIKKTRYLRIDDSLIKYSTDTLAQEFHNRTEPWRHYNNNAKSFSASAQL